MIDKPAKSDNLDKPAKSDNLDKPAKSDMPPAQVEGFKKEMADAEVDMRFVAYPGAAHSFTNPGATEVGKKLGMPLAYNESADEKSWAELETFLGEVFAD